MLKPIGDVPSNTIVEAPSGTSVAAIEQSNAIADRRAACCLAASPPRALARASEQSSVTTEHGARDDARAPMASR
eukprot:COSAG02_NODE_4901_length_4850_cov_2.259735_1_plen_75_part_00